MDTEKRGHTHKSQGDDGPQMPVHGTDKACMARNCVYSWQTLCVLVGGKTMRGEERERPAVTQNPYLYMYLIIYLRHLIMWAPTSLEFTV